MIMSDLSWEDLYPNKATKTKSVLNTSPNSLLEHNFNNDSFQNIACIKKNELETKKLLTSAFSLFTSRTSYPSFTSLDFLLPEPYLLTGCLTIVHMSDKPSRTFAIQFFIQLILKYYKQGVVFIDCTNIFPAYELIEATLENDPSIDPQLPIRAVQLSRSFNYHQTTETVKEQLEPLLRDGFNYKLTNEFSDEPEIVFVKPKIVIVAGLPDLYLNKESAQYLEYDNRPAWWSIFELQETIGYLRSLTLKYNCITIISASTDPLSKIKPLGGRYLGHSASIIIKIATEGMALYGHLIKHPFVAPKETLLQILKKKGKKRASMPLKCFI